MREFIWRMNHSKLWYGGPDRSKWLLSTRHRILETSDRKKGTIAKQNKNIRQKDHAHSFKQTHVAATFFHLGSHCTLRNYNPPETGYSAITLFPESLIQIITTSQAVVASAQCVKIRSLRIVPTTLPLICYRMFVLTQLDFPTTSHELCTWTEKNFQKTLMHMNLFNRKYEFVFQSKETLSKTMSFTPITFLSLSGTSSEYLTKLDFKL